MSEWKQARMTERQREKDGTKRDETIYVFNLLSSHSTDNASFHATAIIRWLCVCDVM